MRMSMLQRLLWGAAALATLIYVGWLLPQSRDRAETASAEAAPFRPEFALSDANGQIRTRADFKDRYLPVFFGCTNCPDVCPTTLSEVAQVMDDLGPKADRIQPLFISIDPERDRRLGLAEFTSAFHPAILGLAGDDVQTRAAADSFKIFFERETDAAAPDGYTMSHSAALFLVGPKGDWPRQFSFGTPASEILGDIQSRL